VPGYLTKQETIAISGAADLQIRSLLDKQQFHDPLNLASERGISSAMWPLFGLLWPSGLCLAERLALRSVRPERVLELGCGLGLASLVGHRLGADVTASDCHPLAGIFLAENLRLNGLAPMDYQHGQWGEFEALVTGCFDLVIASDVLYERDEQGTLAHFIDQHCADTAEVWVVDPNRANRPAFHRHMQQRGFDMRETLLHRPSESGLAEYRGRMLTYVRH
jgi:predicted nicotinamide N-methyase